MIKKMMKRIFSFLMMLFVLFTYIATPISVKAAVIKEPQTIGDLQHNLAELKKQKAENDRKQQSAKDEIKNKKNAITKAEADITQAESDIDEAEAKIIESNERIEGLKEQTEQILKVLQQLQSQNVYLKYISDSSSITDLVMRIAAVEQITDSNQKNLEDLKALIKQNEQLKIDLAQKQKDLESKIGEYQKKIETLYGDLESYDKFELDIDTNIKLAEANLKAIEEDCRKKYGKVVASAKIDEFLVYNAGWLKPLKKGTVTSPEGYRTHPVTGVKYSFHSGIDIGKNAEGTPVYAAAAGTVSGIVNRYSCGGNMVYITVNVGGVKYTTYYYHLLKINVKVGQVVTQNTIIGTVGGGSTAKKNGGYDSCTTGAHLHFGVAKGYYSGSIPTSKVIVPPGFKNQKGYSWTTRTAYAK